MSRLNVETFLSQSLFLACVYIRIKFIYVAE